ncbi:MULTISPECIES: hypothetical protein [unclassified Bradyrhizobium]|uniref:hypothetical protein n=1 Tax=unclassified Bradyrhizobium TaxID=2631580 RepID=UPI00244AC7CD|nr:MULTISPECIES: hypothetical protein [unclassified Bradyrhizobium]MDH2344192.1 hypothetical protein [Bradyrhizobium sp. SSUT77]MDH2356877.1 hypothetical protein [Bradyrhizobium sp. SSUT112]
MILLSVVLAFVDHAPSPLETLAGWIGTRWARGVRLLIVSILLCSGLAAPSFADNPLRSRDAKTQEMVAASVRIETGLGAIYADFRKKVQSKTDPNSPALRAEGGLNHDCSNFIYARFYAKYQALIDKIDTSAFSSPEDLRKNRSDTSILRDPRKIAYETKYRISSFKFLKDFHPPLEEFVVQYSTRPDLEARCTRYLDVTGTRN